MKARYADIEGASVTDVLLRVYEHTYAQGWTDGLPVIPPTEELVAQFISASGRAPGDIVAVLPPRKGEASIEAIAVNAVMAGCRPEYMPVIVAAVEGVGDPAFPLELMQVTTNPMTPLLLINGPIRKRLDINCSTGCLGPGWRANATIGRAMRLVLNNVGGAVPVTWSKSTFGSPLRYSFVLGENEEENPWNPYHVDAGFERAESTVTVFKASSFVNISGGEGVGPEEILRHVATCMPPMYAAGDGAMLLLGVDRARALFEAGLTKKDIQRGLWERARVPISHFAASFAKTQRESGLGDAETIWRTRTPDEFHIVVAGGPGPQDAYIAAGMQQTRRIAEPGAK